MKGIALINQKAIDIFMTIGNSRYRNDYDQVYDDGHAVERIAD
jgi:hypothetical protein